MKLTAYELLDVTPETLPKEIRKAYYRKAQIVHPDHGGTVENFLMLKKAFDYLMSPQHRDVMGDLRLFSPIALRIQPSLHSSLSQLLRNLEVVEKVS
jgi:curved DNA-binding protein CbpA